MNNFYRAGWRKDMIKEGDTVTVTIAPMKDGSDGGYVTNMKTADGHQF
jgi:predicted RNA-binding protein with TRAM domain